ncbi:MAG: hypothetical protein Q4C54_07305 [Clostridia bacterium]|nr:hypothetical protein [Clostridia bacterium]
MQHKKRRWMRTAISMVFAAALMLIYFAFQHVTFRANDDLMMVRTLEGYAGQPVTFNMYLHPALTWLVSSLAAAFPQGHWFTWLMMACQYAAFASLTCTLAEAAGRSRLHEGWGYAVSGVLFALFTREMMYTYTIVAAWLVCAACARAALAIGTEKRDYIRLMTEAAAIALIAVLLRGQVLLPLLCSCGLCGLAQMVFAPGKDRKEKRRACLRVLAMGLAAVLCLGGILITDRLVKRLPENREYVAVNDERTEINDYHAYMATLTDAQLASLGWTRPEADMLTEFCTLDFRFTPEKLHQAVAYARENQPWPVITRLKRGLRLMLSDLPRDPVFPVVLLLAGLTMALMFRTGMKKRLTALTIPFFSFVQVYYLYFCFRYPTRALMLAICPAAAVMAVFLLLQLGAWRSSRSSKPHGAPALIACAASLALVMAVTCGFRAPVISLADDFTPGQRQIACDEYARNHPDLFYFADTVLDDSLYQDTASPRVQNLDYLMGWQTVNPDYYAHLARYGIARAETDFTVFLRPNVRLMTTYPNIYQTLIRAIEALTGQPVKITVEDTVAGVDIVRLSVAE